MKRKVRIQRSEYARVGNYGATGERAVSATCGQCSARIRNVSRDRAFRFLREHETRHFLEHDREEQSR